MIVSVLVWNTVDKLEMEMKWLELSFVPICANILEISFDLTLMRRTWNWLDIVDSGEKTVKNNNLGMLTHRV